MNPPFVLFDLDNTLYPPSSGVMPEMKRRISRFVADYLSVSLEEATELQSDKPDVFGTTLQWLRVCQGLADPEPYIAAVHPADMENWVAPNTELRAFLSSLPADFALFTNSPLEHAQRTLDALGLADLFPRIWDLRRLGYRGKPHRDSYERVLGDLGLQASQAILVDDSRENIRGFEAVGGRTVFAGDDRPATAWMAELTETLGVLCG